MATEAEEWLWQTTVEAYHGDKPKHAFDVCGDPFCIGAREAFQESIAAIKADERARISDGLRALHERLSNEAKPKRKRCECRADMESHAGGWVLLFHDLFIVDRLAAAIVNLEEVP